MYIASDGANPSADWPPLSPKAKHLILRGEQTSSPGQKTTFKNECVLGTQLGKKAAMR
jgi:hypothetical protein